MIKITIETKKANVFITCFYDIVLSLFFLDYVCFTFFDITTYSLSTVIIDLLLINAFNI